MDVNDDVESADSRPVDLTPRAHSARPRASSRRRGFTALVGALVVGAVGFVVVQGLSGATTFFYNVDDAVAKRDEIGDRRVRIQGNVIDDTVDATGERGVSFSLAYGGEMVDVDLTGDVPDLFATGIPVVVEGQFEGERFEADDVLIRHDASYDEENPDRNADATRDAEQNSERDSVDP